jgi:hypothetical protein
VSAPDGLQDSAVGIDRSALERLRQMILAGGTRQLTVGDLCDDDLGGLAWSGNPAQLRSVAAALQRAAQGLEDYLVVRAPGAVDCHSDDLAEVARPAWSLTSATMSRSWLETTRLTWVVVAGWPGGGPAVGAPRRRSQAAVNQLRHRAAAAKNLGREPPGRTAHRGAAGIPAA